MLKLTQKMIENWGGDSVYYMAEAAVKRGAVMRAELNGNEISGEIARNSGTLYCRFTVLPDGSVESHCPCPKNRNDGLICEHVVALGISILQRQNDPVRQQRYIEEQRRARRLEATMDSAIPIDRNGMPAQLLLQLTNNWKKQFLSGGPVNVMCAFRVGNNPVEVIPEQMNRKRPISLSPADELVLQVLEDMDETGLHANMALKKIDFLGLLDVLRGRSLYVSDGSILSVQSQTIPLTVMMDIDRETGNLLLFPQIPENIAPPGTLPEFFAELEKSWVLVKGHLYPLKPTLPLMYHGLYSGDVEIVRSDVLSFIEVEIPRLKKAVTFTFEPGADPNCFSISPGVPKFHLTATGNEKSVSLQLMAVYGKQEVAACSPEVPGAVVEPDPEDFRHFFSRNLPLEHKALARLLPVYKGSNDFIRCVNYNEARGDALPRIVDSQEIHNLLGSLIPSLRRLGWTVDVTGPLSSYYDKLEMAVPIVKVNNAGRGQFDVSIDFELSSGMKLSQGRVLTAVYNRESFLDIGGHCVLLDSEAINSLRKVFDDCDSKPGNAPGHFRMDSVYAPYVQSALNALDGIDIEQPPDWRLKAEKCNRTEKLTPEPLGPLESVLRPYQKEGVYWMRFLEAGGFGGILADEMGLGKTLQTLTWLNLSRKDPESRGKPALIIAPTSLVENWRRECEKFTPWRKCIVMSGASRHSHWDEINGCDIVVTSYALVRRDLEHYAEFEFSAAVLDEAQHIKNRSTQNAIAAKQIRARSKLVLTGTPVENGVADLWSIMDFLMPQYLGRYEAFKSNYELPIAAGDSAGEDAQNRLQKKLRPFLMRRLKKDVAKDLPDKIQKVSFSTLAPDQQKIYDALREVFREKVTNLVKQKGFEHSRMEVLAILLRLRQTCCHLSLLPHEMLGKTSPEAPSGKLEQFFDILDEAIDGGHRMLVFSQFVGMLKIIRQGLDMRGIRYSYIDGETKGRVEECKRFNQDTSISVFPISLKAGGTGLNLTGADMVIHFDPWWNPAVEDQATDRAHRIGQKRMVTSIKLIAQDTVEEKVLALQKRKQSIIQATIGTADSAIMQSLTWEDVKELLS